MTTAGEGVARRVAAVLPEFSFYALASGLALAVDLLAFLGMTGAIAMAPHVAGAISYVLGLMLHFVLSSRFVFTARTGKTAPRLLVEFIVSGLVGLLLTVAIIWAAVVLAGLPALAAKGTAVLVSFLAVYVLRRCLVFR